jgi:ABC-2 type transport system permease protein
VVDTSTPRIEPESGDLNEDRIGGHTARRAMEMSKRPNPIERAVNVWRYRELLLNLTRKELQVKYKNSVLGFVWTLLNPALYLVVFTVVFQEVLQVQIKNYSVFFLAGLLAWNFFSAAVTAGTGSIVGNSPLVSKVWFPREILPLSAIGAAIVHFFLQFTVLIGALLLFRRVPAFDYLIAVLPALLALIIVAAALGIALSATNVYLRDTQHLLELLMLAWFWLTPIAYPYGLLADRLGPAREWMTALNPVLTVVITFQQALYNPTHPVMAWFTNSPNLDPENRFTDQPLSAIPPHSLSWFMVRIGITGLVGLVLLFFALSLFGRLEDNMAEEI